MKVLITWGTKRGGTESIARMIAEALVARGVTVAPIDAARVRSLDGYDAVIVGGALYANRWHHDARRFVTRHLAELRRLPVWLFSSGPLDDSADHQPLAPAPQVAALMTRVGAQAHVTFGGRLAPDATGFPAQAMAKDHAGDWRNPARIRAWADDIAAALPTARPGLGVEPPAHALHRVFTHAAVGWALYAATGWFRPLVAPLVFAAIARHYFRPGARAPAPTALGFAAIAALLDVGLAAVLGRLAMLESISRSWLPLLLIVAVTWTVGAIMSMLPFPKPPAAHLLRDRLEARRG